MLSHQRAPSGRASRRPERMAAAGQSLPTSPVDVEAEISRLVSAPQRPVDDPRPGRFSEHLLVGSAQHAFAIDRLVEDGVTAVINLAPRACFDMRSKYEERGLAYLAMDAEDEAGYALLDRHLDDALGFYQAQARAGGLIFVHCFAGVNRSAALAIAFLILGGEPLVSCVERCYRTRPWILTNAGFRSQLVRLAATARHEPLTPPALTGPTTAVGTARPGECDAPSGAPAAPPASAPYAATAGDGVPLPTYYTLGDSLGEGAFATVYRCSLPGHLLDVAAKVVSREARWVWIGGRSVSSERAYDALCSEHRALLRVSPHVRSATDRPRTHSAARGGAMWYSVLCSHVWPHSMLDLTMLGLALRSVSLAVQPRIVGVDGFITEPQRAILLLELAPGGDAEALAARHPAGMPAATVHSFAVDLLSALAHCHENGVCHRDVKL